MSKLELLYSYKEWKEDDLRYKLMPLSETTAKMLSLAMNFNRTEKDEEEYQSLRHQSDINYRNAEYTKLTHIITDIYNDLKNTHRDDTRQDKYIEIGRMQCEIEILKEQSDE